MYKVLLADDEILDLEGMRAFVPWNDLGMEVVEAVNNGFSAYNVIENRDVDVLVTDVRMPNMTGLELARKAIAKKGDLRIIFVSGHQDFHYVKQALSLNACDYVLKPMNDRELIDSLKKVREELDAARKRREEEESLRRRMPVAQNVQADPTTEAWQDKRYSKNGKLIQDIILYMKERLHENITLKQIAEVYSFSPNYLGLLFKEETERNFSDYLIKLRMDKAGELLARTNLKIYEIADQVGYRYLPYFSRQFREYYGATPLEYRRRL